MHRLHILWSEEPKIEDIRKKVLLDVAKILGYGFVYYADTPPVFSVSVWAVNETIYPVVTLHVSVGGYTDNKTELSYILDRAAELGAKYIRTDFWWSKIEPEDDVWNQSAINFYHWFIN